MENTHNLAWSAADGVHDLKNVIKWNGRDYLASTSTFRVAGQASRHRLPSPWSSINTGKGLAACAFFLFFYIFFFSVLLFGEEKKNGSQPGVLQAQRFYQIEIMDSRHMDDATVSCKIVRFSSLCVGGAYLQSLMSFPSITNLNFFDI